ncbi:BAI_1a_G0022680.mRNA.1.CDS.1 [Saccharomyces cerevisiae]|nr:BAI_1a_G0022680.mRNA.1.CDS.1 [Saccharomyces cerevisiae]CAI7139835.1 BAI_1a_G0022680.mRNA.1.CDS.1 [Saccharomyces cerevisiae]
MEMTLFLNESYIFHRLRMWSTVFWGLCLFVCAECDSANNRVPRCLIKPFSVPLKFPFSVKKNIRILDLDPRTEAYV